MKKFILLLLIFLITYPISSQHQSGEIKYGQTVENMVIDTASIDDSYVKQVIVEQYVEKQNALSLDENYYSLKFKGGKSVFTRLNRMNNDG